MKCKVMIFLVAQCMHQLPELEALPVGFGDVNNHLVKLHNHVMYPCSCNIKIITVPW